MRRGPEDIELDDSETWTKEDPDTGESVPIVTETESMFKQGMKFRYIGFAEKFN